MKIFTTRPSRSRQEKRRGSTGVRVVPSQNGTRVVMEVSRPVRYEVGRLPEDSARGLPPRIYVDIAVTTLALESLEPVNVHQTAGIKQIRVGQFNGDTVRVVLDMNATLGTLPLFCCRSRFVLCSIFRASHNAGPSAAPAKVKPSYARGRHVEKRQTATHGHSQNRFGSRSWRERSGSHRHGRRGGERHCSQ